VRLPAFNKLQMPSDAESWLGKVLFPLNNFLERIYSLVNGNLVLGDNIKGQFIDIIVADPTVATKLSWPNGPKIKGIILLSVLPAGEFSPTYQVIGEQLVLGPWPAVTAGTYTIKLFILTE
jgi:hypothetical protein